MYRTRRNLRLLLSQSRRLARPLLIAGVFVGALAQAAPATAAPSATQIEQQIAAQSARLEKVIEAYNKSSVQLADLNRAAVTLRANMKPYAARLAVANQRFATLASLAYKGQNIAEVGAVLTAPDPQQLVDRLITIDQFARADGADIATYAGLRDGYEAKLAQLNQLILQQQANRAGLTAERGKIEREIARLNKLRAANGLQASRPTAVTAPIYVAGKAGIAVRYAYAAIGKPYVWAAAGPGGYDCSGLTLASWRAAGLSLPHNAAMQWSAVAHISRSQLQPGDLVFYSGLGHVAIYVGGGQIIHAPTPGEYVKLASVDMMSPYGYGRPR